MRGKKIFLNITCSQKDFLFLLGSVWGSLGASKGAGEPASRQDVKLCEPAWRANLSIQMGPRHSV